MAKIRRPNRRFPSQAPSNVLDTIQELSDAPKDSLSILLDNIEKWEFGKTDLLLWANILDKFDDIFEETIDNLWNKQSGLQEKPFNIDELRLILAILKFTRLLLENSSSRNLFASYDKLKKFLSSNNLFVIVATLELLILPAYKLEIHNALRTTFEKEIGTMELAAFARMETTSSDQSKYYQNLKKFEEWEEYKDLISYAENLALGIFMMATSEQQLEVGLFSQRPTIIPDTAKLVFEALKRQNHLDAGPLIVLRGILKVSIKWTDIVHALQLASATGPIITALHELFQSLQNQSIPDKSLKNEKDKEKENINSSTNLFFLSAFVELFTCLISCGDCDEALVQSGIIGEILQTISIKQDFYSRYLEKMLYSLDLLISHVSTSIDQFFSLHGLVILVRELEELVGRLANPLSVSRINQDVLLVSLLKFLSKILRKYNGDVRLRNLIEGSLFTTIKNIASQIGTQNHEAIAYSITIVSIFIHSEPSTLAILQEIKLPQTILESINQYLPPNEHVILQLPQCIEAFCLNSFGLELFKSFNPFGILLESIFLDRRMMNVLSANGALNFGDSLDEFVRHYPQFRDLIINKCIDVLNLFSKAIDDAKKSFSFQDSSATVPSSSESLSSASSSSFPSNVLIFRNNVANAINGGLANLDAKSIPLVPISTSSISTSSFLAMNRMHEYGHLRESFSRFCEVLESFFRTETTIQGFILANGVYSLLSGIDGVTITFGKTIESTSISSLLLRIGQSNHLALGNAFIDSMKPLILSTELSLLIQYEKDDFSFFEMINDKILGQAIYNHLSGFLALVSLLLDVLRSISSIHDRILSSFIMIFLGDDGKAMMIFLTLLSRSCIWQYYKIYHGLPESWKHALNLKFQTIFDQNQQFPTLPSSLSTQLSGLVEPDPNDPIVQSTMNILFVCQQIASTGISLFGCLGRLVHDPRCLLGDDEKNQVQSLISNALIHCLSWLKEKGEKEGQGEQGIDLSNNESKMSISPVWIDCFAILQSFAFEIFFEDKNDNICWTRVLLYNIEAFIKINGFDDYISCIKILLKSPLSTLNGNGEQGKEIEMKSFKQAFLPPSLSSSYKSSINVAMEKIFTLLGRFLTVNSYKSKQIEELASVKKTFIANLVQFISTICLDVLRRPEFLLHVMDIKSKRIFLTTLTGLIPFNNDDSLPSPFNSNENENLTLYSECIILPLIRSMSSSSIQNNLWSESVKAENYPLFNEFLQYFFESSLIYDLVANHLPLDLCYEGALLLARMPNMADCIKRIMMTFPNKYVIIGHLLASFRMIETVQILLLYYENIEIDFLNENDESSLARLMLILSRLHSTRWWWIKEKKETKTNEQKEEQEMEESKTNNQLPPLLSLEFKNKLFNQIIPQCSSVETVHSVLYLLHVLARKLDDFNDQEIKTICTFAINHSVDFLHSPDPRHRTIIHLSCLILRTLIDNREYLAGIMENHLLQLSSSSSDGLNQNSFYLDQISSVGNDAIGMRNWPLFIDVVGKSFIFKDDNNTLISHISRVMKDRGISSLSSPLQSHSQQIPQIETENTETNIKNENQNEKESINETISSTLPIPINPKTILNDLKKSPLATLVMETLLDSILNLKNFSPNENSMENNKEEETIEMKNSHSLFINEISESNNHDYQTQYHTRCAILFFMNELVASYPVCHQAIIKSNRFKDFLNLCYDKLIPTSGGDFVNEKTDYLGLALFVDRLLTQICVGSIESNSKDLYPLMMDSCRILIESLGENLRQDLDPILLPSTSPFQDSNSINNEMRNENQKRNNHSRLSKIWSLNITITSLLNMKVESHRIGGNNGIGGLPGGIGLPSPPSLFATSHRFASHVRKTIAALMLEQRFVPLLSDQLALINGVHMVKGANIISNRIMINLETLCKFGNQLKSVPGNAAIADLPSVRQVTREELFTEEVEEGEGGLPSSSTHHHIEDHMIVDDEEDEDHDDDEYDTENEDDGMHDDQIEILTDFSESSTLGDDNHDDDEDEDDSDDTDDDDNDDDVEMSNGTEDDEDEAYSEDMYDTDEDMNDDDDDQHSDSEESVQLIIRPPDRDITSNDRPVNITVDIRVSTEPNAIGFDDGVEGVGGIEDDLINSSSMITNISPRIEAGSTGNMPQIIRYNTTVNGGNGGIITNNIDGRGMGNVNGRQRTTSFRLPSSTSMIIDTSGMGLGEGINIHDIQSITTDLLNYQQSRGRGGMGARGRILNTRRREQGDEGIIEDDIEGGEDIIIHEDGEDDQIINSNYPPVMGELFDEGDNEDEYDYEDDEYEEDEEEGDLLSTSANVIPNAWNISVGAGMGGMRDTIGGSGGNFDPRNRIFRSRQRNVPRINYPFTFTMIEAAIPGIITNSTPGAIGLGAIPLGAESYVQIIRPGDISQHSLLQRPTILPATLNWSRNIDLSVYADWLGELKKVGVINAINPPSLANDSKGKMESIETEAETLEKEKKNQIYNIEVLRNINIMTTVKRYQQSQQLLCGDLAKEINRKWIELTRSTLLDATKSFVEKYPIATTFSLNDKVENGNNSNNNNTGNVSIPSSATIVNNQEQMQDQNQEQIDNNNQNQISESLLPSIEQDQNQERIDNSNQNRERDQDQNQEQNEGNQSEEPLNQTQVIQDSNQNQIEQSPLPVSTWIDHGPDIEFLIAMPYSLRAEVLQQHFRERRQLISPENALVEIDPNFLRRLPEDLRNDYIRYSDSEIRRYSRRREGSGLERFFQGNNASIQIGERGGSGRGINATNQLITELLESFGNDGGDFSMAIDDEYDTENEEEIMEGMGTEMIIQQGETSERNGEIPQQNQQMQQQSEAIDPTRENNNERRNIVTIQNAGVGGSNRINSTSLATRIASELALALQHHQRQQGNFSTEGISIIGGGTSVNRDHRHHLVNNGNDNTIINTTFGNGSANSSSNVTNQILRAITNTFEQIRRGHPSLDPNGENNGIIISTTTVGGGGTRDERMRGGNVNPSSSSININRRSGGMDGATTIFRTNINNLLRRGGITTTNNDNDEIFAEGNSNINTRDGTTTSGTIESFIKIKNFEPLADSHTLCNILLGYFDKVLGDKKSHCKVLLYLSENSKIRQDLLNVLILILEEKPWTFGDLASLLCDYLKTSTLSLGQSLGSGSTAIVASGGIATTSSTSATIPSSSTPSSTIIQRNSSNPNSSRPSTPGASSNRKKNSTMTIATEGVDVCIVILQRCLQLLFYLVTRNVQVKAYFTNPCTKPWTIKRVITIQNQKKEKGEEILTTQFPIVLLLAALDNSLILQTNILSEQLLHLLASVSGPIRDLVEKKNSPISTTAGIANTTIDNVRNNPPSLPSHENDSNANVNVNNALVTSSPILLPEIPNHFLHLLVKALVQIDLTPIAFGHAMNVFQNICNLEGEQFETILKELFGSANKILLEKNIGSNASLHFVKLVRLLKIANSILIKTRKFDGNLGFNFAASNNNTTASNAIANTTTTVTATATGTSINNMTDEPLLWQPDSLVDNHNFTLSLVDNLVEILSKPVWNEVFDRIHERLSCIPDEKSVDHPKMVNEYLGIIETFFLRTRILSALLSYNNFSPVSIPSIPLKEQHQEKDQQDQEQLQKRNHQNIIFAESIESNLIQFTERHRRIINAIIRQDSLLLLSGSLSLLIRHTRLLDFDNKRVLFKKILHRRSASLSTGGIASSSSSYGTTLSIRRPHLFDESFAQVMSKRSEEFKHGRLHVKFIGEEGVDAGGLTREWFSSLAKQMFNADYALFKPASIDKITYQPNRASWVNPDHLRYFEFVGRIIGKAIYDGRLLDCHFTRSFYKHILGKQVTFKDLEGEDPEFFKSLQWILDNNIEDVFVGQTFTIDTEEFGQLKTIPLCPNGADQLVNETNKKDYVQLVTEFKLYGEVAAQIDAFLVGFHSIVPASLISIFDEGELELLLSGIPEIDIDDWRNHTDYHGYSSSSPQIQWFWRAIRSFDTEQRCRLLQFVTGTSKVPLEGFGALPGSSTNANSRSSSTRFSIHKSYATTSTNNTTSNERGIGETIMTSSKGRLPTAHTCFNQLDLPEYDNYDELRRMLLKAIEEGAEGFGFA